MTAQPPDPFADLGLPAAPDLTDEQVRAAWRTIATATHPDRPGGGDQARYAEASAAYAVLRTAWGRTEAYADLAAATPPALLIRIIPQAAAPAARPRVSPLARRSYALRSRVRCRICQRRMCGTTRTARRYWAEGPDYAHAYYKCSHDADNPRHAAAHPDHPAPSPSAKTPSPA